MAGNLQRFRTNLLIYASVSFHENGEALTADEKFRDSFANLLGPYRIGIIRGTMERDEVINAIKDFNIALSENNVFSNFRVDETKFLKDAELERIIKSPEVW